MKGIRFGEKRNQFVEKLLEKLKRIRKKRNPHLLKSREIPNLDTNPFLDIDIKLTCCVNILMLGV